MHTQYRELPPLTLLLQLQSMFYHSPFPIHGAVLSGFRYSLGRAACWATRDAEATAAHPYTHSIYRKPVLHRIIPFPFRIAWMFLLADRLRRQNHDVLWLAFYLVGVCVCMHVYVCYVFVFGNHVSLLQPILYLFCAGPR